LPFILTLLIQALEFWANTCRLEIREFVNIEGVVTGTPPEQQYYDTKTTWLPNVEQFVPLDFWSDYEAFCVNLLGFCSQIEEEGKTPFFIICKCIIRILWIISWSYLLIFTII
jgi:hypothetical protein